MVTIRYFIDCEFLEDAQRVDLLSVGIVAEDGREFYAEVWDFPRQTPNEWVRANVLPHLQHYNHGNHVSWDDFPSCPAARNSQLPALIRSFCDPSKYGPPEFWTDCGAFDYVVLSNLFGGMDQWPDGWPYWFCDLQQWRMMLGNPELPAPAGTEHHALSDAHGVKQRFEWLNDYALNSGQAHWLPERLWVPAS